MLDTIHAILAYSSIAIIVFAGLILCLVLIYCGSYSIYDCLEKREQYLLRQATRAERLVARAQGPTNESNKEVETSL